MPDLDDLSRLSAAEIDALPFGYIALAPDGTVRKYNRFEADLARKDPREVLGKNFFRDVAPCTQVQEFEGRFRELAAGARPGSALGFDFEFRFRHGMQKVRITLVRSPLEREVIVTVNRVPRLDLALSAEVRPDPTRGTLEDAAGQRVLVTHGDFWQALEAPFRGLPADRRREALHRIGREWGLAHAQRAERLVQRQHGVTLREAELQMALLALSGSVGVSGLGSFDVDFRFRARGVIVVRHRDSPFAHFFSDREEPCCDLLAGLHAGFLSHLSGRTLAGAEVHCGRRPGEECRFLIATESRLARLMSAADAEDAALRSTVAEPVTGAVL